MAIDTSSHAADLTQQLMADFESPQSLSSSVPTVQSSSFSSSQSTPSSDQCLMETANTTINSVAPSHAELSLDTFDRLGVVETDSTETLSKTIQINETTLNDIQISLTPSSDFDFDGNSTKIEDDPLESASSVIEEADKMVKTEQQTSPEEKEQQTSPEEKEQQTSPEEMIQELAKSLYNGTCRSVSHYNAASWIGDSGTERGLVRKAYMAIFDWEGISVLGAIRGLCDRLYMKAESQQLDRIVDTFSDRWCECNSNHGFKATSVIYTLAYSILLLNTDHHSEEYSSSRKMPRSQYVQSTLQAMSTLALAEEKESSINDAASVFTSKSRNPRSGGNYNFSTRKRNTSNEFGASSESITLVNRFGYPTHKEWENTVSSLLKSVYISVDITPLNLARSEKELRTSISHGNTNNRNSFMEGPNSTSRLFSRRSWMGGSGSGSGSENLSDYDYSDAIANNGLSATPHGKRRSFLPSSNTSISGTLVSSSRSSIYDTSEHSSPHPDHNIGFAGALWSSIIREEQEKGSIYDASSIVAPLETEDSKISAHESTDSLQPLSESQGRKPISGERPTAHADAKSVKKPTARSIHPTMGDPAWIDLSAPRIGAPGNIPNSIYSSSQESSKYYPYNDRLQEEEMLTLNGAPWAKEGLLKFQAFFEKDAMPKRYKKKGWTQLFVVVQAGYLKMFQFEHGPVKKKSLSLISFKKEAAAAKDVAGITRHDSIDGRAENSANIGSGNWLDNATMIDNVSLCHTMAQIIHISKDGTDLLGVLPGSSSRTSKKTNLASHNGDNVQWSLKLPSGGVIAFLAGTREIADEYVYTCNYWAARVSREPLVEAVSSSEFGWGKPLDFIFGYGDVKSSDSSSSSISASNQGGGTGSGDSGVKARGGGGGGEGKRPPFRTRSKSISYTIPPVPAVPLSPLDPEFVNSNTDQEEVGSPKTESPKGGFKTGSLLGNSTLKARDLFRKKSSPNLSTSAKLTVQHARSTASWHSPRSNFAKSHAPDPSLSSVVSSQLNFVARVRSASRGGIGIGLGSGLGTGIGTGRGRELLVHELSKAAAAAASFNFEGLEGITTTSASAASASATAAATSLLYMNPSTLMSSSMYKRSGLKSMTTKITETGTLISGSGSGSSQKKFYVASGSFDTMFLNNTMIKIKEWRAPVHSAVHSMLDEANQLDTLDKYTLIVDAALQDHTSLRGELMTVFQAHLLVAARVTANWEKRSNYLLSEAVKYEIYISTLSRAIGDRKKTE